MGKRIKTLIGTLAICLAAFSVPVYAKGKGISFVRPLEAGQGFTSLKFSAEVKNVSDNAKVSVDFDKSIPEKTVAKTTYKNGILTIYLAGGEELFPDSTLEIGEITVKNDENNGKNLYVELLPETVEIVNSGYTVVEDIEAVRDEIKLTGSGTEAPEEEEPEEEKPDVEDPDKEEPDAESPETEELEKLLDGLKNLKAEDYTQESWNTVAALMEQAFALLESETATQEQIDNMVKQLEAAKEGLQTGTTPSPNIEQAKQKLQTLLDELDQLLSSEYTTESWNELYALMEEARGILEKGASKSEYDAMTEKLLEAQSNLVKVEKEPGKVPGAGSSDDGQHNTISGQPVKPENPQKPQNPIQETIKGVLTGDNTPVIALALAGIISIAVIAGVLFNKKMQKK